MLTTTADKLVEAFARHGVQQSERAPRGVREAVEASDGAEAYALAVLAGLCCVFTTPEEPLRCEDA